MLWGEVGEEMTDQEQEPWPEKVYLLHPSIKTFGAMVSNPERREYVLADRIEELERGMDALQDRLDAANKARADANFRANKKQFKLAKAVDALRFYADGLRNAGLARAALAELEGKQ